MSTEEFERSDDFIPEPSGCFTIIISPCIIISIYFAYCAYLSFTQPNVYPPEHHHYISMTTRVLTGLLFLILPAITTIAIIKRIMK